MDYLFNRELAQINPLLGLSAELATNEIKEKAELSLLEKLEQNPQILFEVSPLLNGHFKRCEEQFCEMISEMIIRINADRKAIRSAFFGGLDFGNIIKIDGDADKHQTYNHRRARKIPLQAAKYESGYGDF